MTRLFLAFLLLLSGIFCSGQDLVFNHLIAENGLSQNSVFAICQDPKGFMWFGTRYGLNRYDGVNFKLFVSAKGKPETLTDDYITALYADKEGILWVGTVNGLNKFDEETETFERIYLNVGVAAKPVFVYNIFQDAAANIWVNTDKGLFLKKRNSDRFVCLIRNIENFSMLQDDRASYWVGTSKGLVHFTLKKDKMEQMQTYEVLPSASGTGIALTSMVQYGKKLWMGTENRGLLCFDMQSGESQSFTRMPDGLIHNSIRKLILTSGNEIWIGTQEGLNVLNPDQLSFRTYQHKSSLSTSLNQNSIYSLFEDRAGSVWVGTYYGGVNVTSVNSTPFHHIRYTDSGNSLNHNIVSSILEDETGNLWVGTEGGGLNYYDLNNRRARYYRNKLNDQNSLGSDFVKKIYKDRDGGLWIGTHGGGLNYFDKSTSRFRHFVIQKNVNPSRTEVVAIIEHRGLFYVGTQTGLYAFTRTGDKLNAQSLTGNQKLAENLNIKFLYEDSAGNLWVCTTSGIFKFMPNGAWQKFTPKNSSNSISKNSNYCNFIFEDSRKDIWIGLYYGGLMKLNKDKNVFDTLYDVSKGLPNNNVLAIVEDQHRNLWITTSKGLAKFNLDTRTFLNYTVADGLPADEFNYNSFYKDKRGWIFFGGYKGLTYFDPEAIKMNGRHSNIVFTNLYLDGKLLHINDENHILTRSLNHTQKLVFKSNQNIFTIEFALLNFIKSGKNKYAYTLQGINNTWIETTVPSATYINLPPGDYKLLIKGANNDGIWSGENAIDIRILPPFYKTWWAILIYFLILGLILFFIVRYFFLQQLLLKEDELHQLKLNFFTNVSHEIRTHITLLLAPVDKLLEHPEANKNQEKSFLNVKASANRLLRLVNELMDFRKAETKNLRLSLGRHDMVEMINEILDSFREYLENKQIQVVFSHPEDPVFMNFDKVQLEKVFFNIISNAYKFTAEQGTIRIEILKQHDMVVVVVEDDGNGIEKQYLDKLFNNFFQVEDYKVQNTGYGIGLALSKHIVELHNGSIQVESERAAAENKGFTKFYITLPLGEEVNLISTGITVAERFGGESYVSEQLTEPDTVMEETVRENGPSPAYHILIVDDNKEIREIIRDVLKDTYQITMAENGFDALQLALQVIPDLIISDVMMPNMNGYALCKSLKTDERTSHIPVLLLTAKDKEDDFISGYADGADQYLTKPFSAKLLRLNVDNLIKLKENIRNKFSKRFFMEPGEVVLDSMDEKFLSKLIYIIESNLENELFNVHLLAEQAGMSTSVLYKKIKALTNVSVNEFIKSIRLKRAAQILQQKKYTVYEVGYMIGFSDSKYFSRAFRKQFGLTPTEYVKQAEVLTVDK